MAFRETSSSGMEVYFKGAQPRFLVNKVYLHTDGKNPP